MRTQLKNLLMDDALINAIDSVRGDASFAAWVRRVCRNALPDKLRPYPEAEFKQGPKRRNSNRGRRDGTK